MTIRRYIFWSIHVYKNLFMYIPILCSTNVRGWDFNLKNHFGKLRYHYKSIKAIFPFSQMSLGESVIRSIWRESSYFIRFYRTQFRRISWKLLTSFLLDGNFSVVSNIIVPRRWQQVNLTMYTSVKKVLPMCASFISTFLKYIYVIVTFVKERFGYNYF